MKLFNILLLLTLTCVSSQNTSTTFLGRNCPPDGFDSLNEFDFEEFISARWYSIEQKEVLYQPLSQFYCVYADYELADFCPFCLGRPKITVFNSARKGSVTGEVRSVNFRAVVPFPRRHPARANVGPRFLPLGLSRSTNYWVVDAGSYDDILVDEPRPSGVPYEWAIITTGRPNREGDDGNCYTRGGMWIFARNSEPGPAVIEAVRNRATELGLDVSQLLPVEHVGCVY